MSTNSLDRNIKRRTLLKAGLALGALQIVAPVVSNAATALKRYGPGATDSQIKIGNIMPYSGPASAYATIGKTETAFFQMINDEGGIIGRRIHFISYDDGYSPPKTFEQARKLVEDDNILLIFNSLGTPTNSAIHGYMNEKKVPQLFVATGATKWNDPKHFPWTMGWQPSYQTEGRIYATYILKEMPSAKIAILYQNDDYGKDYIKGLKDGLGAQGEQRWSSANKAYEDHTKPTIDSQDCYAASGRKQNVVFNVATTKIRSASHHRRCLKSAGSQLHIPEQCFQRQLAALMKPAGFDHAQGIISAAYLKETQDRSRSG